MSDRTFSQEEIDYILSFIDKSTDWCTTDDDFKFDDMVRKKLDTLKPEPTIAELVDTPKTMGDCWDIFKRNGIILSDNNPLDKSLFPNARRLLEMEKNNISKISVEKLVDELRKRDGVEAWEVPDDGDANIYIWDTPALTTDAKIKANRIGKAIIFRITE